MVKKLADNKNNMGLKEITQKTSSKIDSIDSFCKRLGYKKILNCKKYIFNLICKTILTIYYLLKTLELLKTTIYKTFYETIYKSIYSRKLGRWSR